MGKKYTIEEHTLTNIANGMRMWTGKETVITPDEMPQEVDNVFNAGADIGYTTGHDHGKREGIEEGRQAERSEFWDEFQKNGSRTNYTYGFSGYGWTDETFKPKYDIKPTDAFGMLTMSAVEDLEGALKRQGVVMDTSNATRVQNMFNYSSVKYAGFIDTQKSPVLTQMCDYASALVSISLGLRPAGTQTFQNAFRGCTNLEELIIVYGVIGKDGFNVSDCQKLTKASLTSIVSALSTTTTGLTVTLSKTAVDNAFAVYDAENDYTLIGSQSGEWQAWVASRPNWTIVLA